MGKALFFWLVPTTRRYIWTYVLLESYMSGRGMCDFTQKFSLTMREQDTMIHIEKKPEVKYGFSYVHFNDFSPNEDVMSGKVYIQNPHDLTIDSDWVS